MVTLTNTEHTHTHTNTYIFSYYLQIHLYFFIYLQRQADLNTGAHTRMRTTIVKRMGTYYFIFFFLTLQFQL